MRFEGNGSHSVESVNSLCTEDIRVFAFVAGTTSLLDSRGIHKEKALLWGFKPILTPHVEATLFWWVSMEANTNTLMEGLKPILAHSHVEAPSPW